MPKKKNNFRLAHVSDTHIRNLKYHDDYRVCFEQMYSILREEKPDYIVHCGDVAHTKTQLSPEFFEMAVDFFDSLSDIAPLVLIAGNHDGNLKNSSRQDALTPVIKALGKKSIHYLKNSGEFSPCKGLTFNVLSVFDRDNWVQPANDKSINIALYHGAIAGVETDIGWVMDHGEDDVSIFAGHDYAFLGDIHKTNQILDTEGRVRYCGSTVQQNFGETNDKGFLIWDIKDKDTFDVRHFILENPRPFITIELTKTGRLPKAVNPPEGARLRIISNSSLPIEKVRKAIDVTKTKFKPESVTFLNRATGSRSKVDLNEDFEKYNLRDIAVQEQLISEYLQDYLSDTDEDKEILKEVMEINRRVNAQAESQERASYRNVNWSIKTLEWNNLFNYGEGNKIDFDSLGGIVGIFGKNFSGKSSIIDSLLWVLFNTTSKRNKKSIDIVNQNRPSAWGRIVIEMDNRHYTIERTADKYTKRLKGEETEEVKTNVEFSVYDLATEESQPLNGETRSQTDENIRKFFSSIDDFLMTSLSSQLDSLAFISKGSTDRKAILGKFLDLELFDTKYTIAKSESSLLDGKIRHLIDVPGEDGYKEAIKNAQSKVFICEEKVTNQQKQCAQLNEEINEMAMRVMKIETRLDSTPIQKIIDVDEVRADISHHREDIKLLNDANEELEEKIKNNDIVLKRIDNFIETFDYQSWKGKKQKLEDLKAELQLAQKNSQSYEREQRSVLEKKGLLEQVPCGSEFSHCKFIRSAYEKLKEESEIDEKVLNCKSVVSTRLIQIKELEPDTVEKYLGQYEEVIQKRHTQREEVSNLELEVAKNKTTLVRLRTTLNTLLEDVRLYEENEKVLKEFVVLSKERDKLVIGKNRKIRDLDECKLKSSELSKKQGIIEGTIEKLTESHAALELARKEFSAYDLYRKAMGSNGVSLDIIKKELPIINDEIAKILANVVNFEVFLENEEKQLKVLIKHPSFEPRPLEMGSGAEKTISAMAIRLAFINVSSLPIGDIFILDEPGTALDEENMEGFIRILDLVKSHFKNVILISHLDSLKDAVDLQISIEKKDKFAFVNQ